MFGASIIVLFANLVLAAPATLAPRIAGESGSQLGSPNGQYTLSIRHPDGKTLREETVKQVPPGVPEVKGTLIQNFDVEGGTLVVTYEAGPNGYVAKYKYTIGQEFSAAPALGIGLLKSLPG
ncbi:uncharacterized protein LOC115764897 isoform X2 [Drosophila novamexicana]|uniref:uncharacterized protein LOC115764897 isoform X2 n=1 Tax=Drosophila novamexicana TaxID=47314 RepID=UPI0011E5AED7|nr:uncharacterized protein LOC115764897 isoform X2 [Drosophila novamexicana]